MGVPGGIIEPCNIRVVMGYKQGRIKGITEEPL